MVTFLTGKRGESIGRNSLGRDIPPGVVIYIDSLKHRKTWYTNLGHVDEPLGNRQRKLSIAGKNEVVYAYHVSGSAPSVFLSAFAMKGGFQDTTGTLSGTGLVHGATAVGAQKGQVLLCDPELRLSWNDPQSQISNIGNWAYEKGQGDQSHDGGIDFPESVPLAYGGSRFPVVCWEANGFYEDKRTKVDWITFSETDIDSFIVERYTDRGYNDIIASVPGSGTGVHSAWKQYYVEDTMPPVSDTRYRIVGVDTAGTRHQLAEVLVEIKAPRRVELKVFPNPTTEKITLVPDMLYEETRVQVFDLNGRKFLDQDFPELKTSTEVDVGSLPIGTYILTVHSGRSRFGTRFIKQ